MWKISVKLKKNSLTITVIQNEGMFPDFATFYVIMELHQAVYRKYKL